MTDQPVITATNGNSTPPPVATLSDLEPSLITIVVTLVDDSEVTIPLKLVPQYRMMRLNAMVPSAMPPVVDYDLKNSGRPVYNYNDSTFIADSVEVNWKRNCLIMAEMIQLPIPGETLDERATYIREHFDPLVTDQLAGVIGERREKAKARIVTRAETFHG